LILPRPLARDPRDDTRRRDTPRVRRIFTECDGRDDDHPPGGAQRRRVPRPQSRVLGVFHARHALATRDVSSRRDPRVARGLRRSRGRHRRGNEDHHEAVQEARAHRLHQGTLGSAGPRPRLDAETRTPNASYPRALFASRAHRTARRSDFSSPERASWKASRHPHSLTRAMSTLLLHIDVHVGRGRG
jgi:hypothetical protein